MKRIPTRYLFLMFLAALFSAAFTDCVSTPHPVKRNIALRYDDDIKLDHNLVMVCAYDNTLNQIGCMSPEQFEIRREAGEFK